MAGITAAVSLNVLNAPLDIRQTNTVNRHFSKHSRTTPSPTLSSSSTATELADVLRKQILAKRRTAHPT